MSDVEFCAIVYWAVPAVAAVGALAIAGLVLWIFTRDAGSMRMRGIAEMIRKGAGTFLLAEYGTMLWIVLALGGVLAWLVSPRGAACFVAGAFCSALAGAVGMRVATAANVRTAAAGRLGVGPALAVALSGGSVMGLSVATLGLLGMTQAYAWFRDVRVVSCYAMGASLAALFARVGGGIYTKAADMGADLVGKVEANIPEDDPRNPGVIADNVGDNVGDVAGMGADLFESYVGALFSAIALGSLQHGLAGACMPILVMACGLVGSLVVVVGLVFRARRGAAGRVSLLLAVGTGLAAVLAAGAALVVAWALFGSVQLGLVVLMGAAAGIIIGKATEYYTSGRCVERIAEASLGGAATNLVAGLSVGLSSTAVPAVVIAATTIGAYEVGDLYGIALGGVGMLCTLGMTLSVDAYGPIADNAGGIAQMARLEEGVRKITDRLDAVGNTTAAVGKGFAIGSAALTALALFSSFAAHTGLKQIDLTKPIVYVGALVGAVLPFVFSSLVIHAVSRTAGRMIEEIRRQFRRMESRPVEPDYRNCIRIATGGALRGMLFPTVLAAATPIAMFLTFGIEAVAGLLVGATITGVILAVFMANAGGAWDNAKKFIEEDHFGGKGSFAHQAAVVGDTVGDPLKDTAGPSINILIKLIAIISIVVIPVIAGG